MDKDEKSTHSKFHRYQTDGYWFSVGVNYFGCPFHGGRGREFFMVTRRMGVCLKSGKPTMVEEGG